MSLIVKLYKSLRKNYFHSVILNEMYNNDKTEQIFSFLFLLRFKTSQNFRKLTQMNNSFQCNYYNI